MKRNVMTVMAAGLLTAAGLPELITTSLADYARLARELASNAERLAALRTRLAGQRLNVPLFDTVQFTRDLERVVCDVAARAGLITEPHT